MDAELLGRGADEHHLPDGVRISNTGASSKANLTATIAFGYDGNNNINDIKDKNGNHVTSTYDVNSIETLSDALPTPNTTTFAFNPTNTVVTDQNSHQTTYNYVDSRLRSFTDPTNATASTSYDDYNNVYSVTNKNSQTTTYGYTNNGFANSVAQPLTPDNLHHTTTTTYTATNKPQVVTDPLGYVSGATITDHQVTYTYSTDGKDDLLSVKDQLGRSTTYGSYTLYGLPGTGGVEVGGPIVGGSFDNLGSGVTGGSYCWDRRFGGAGGTVSGSYTRPTSGEGSGALGGKRGEVGGEEGGGSGVFAGPGIGGSAVLPWPTTPPTITARELIPLSEEMNLRDSDGTNSCPGQYVQ